MKKLLVLPVVLGFTFLQSCSTSKSETDVMWVGGVKTECDSGSGKTECLNVYKGEDLKKQNWENMYASIEGFEFEEGYMKKIEVSKEEMDAKDTPADASSIKYTLVRNIEKKEDQRTQMKGDWVLATINGININKMVVLPTLKVNLKEMRISGNAGCNEYGAQIESLTTEELKLSHSLGTLKACANENIEEEYFQAIGKVRRYTVEDNKLIFSNEEGEEVLTYIVVDDSQPNPALGGAWKNIKINGENVSNEDVATMTFDLEKLMVAGSDGCNNYNTSIEKLSNNALVFGDIAATKMMCPDMKSSDKFQNALRLTTNYVIDANELKLMDQNNKVVLVFSKK